MTLGRAAKDPEGQKRGRGSRAGRRRGVRAESSLGRPPAAGTETTEPPQPLAPAVTGQPRSPRLTQPPAALRLSGSFRAGGAARGGAHGAWAAGTGRAPRWAGRGGAVTGPSPPPPARPAGADSPVSLGLSNCPDAHRPPFPETAAGPGRSGEVGWPRLPDAGVRPQAGRDPRALGRTVPTGLARMATSAPPAGARAHRTLWLRCAVPSGWQGASPRVRVRR